MMKKLIALFSALGLIFMPVVHAAPLKPAKKIIKTHKVSHGKPVKKANSKAVMKVKAKGQKHLPKHGKKIVLKHPLPAAKAHHNGPRVAY